MKTNIQLKSEISNILLKVRCYQLIVLAILGTAKLTAQPLNNHLIFDGTNDYISLNNMDVTGNAMTLEAWINSSNLNNCTNNQCRIISKTTGTDPNDHYWMLSTNISGDNTVLRFRVKTDIGNTTSLVASTGNLATDTWHHVAGTYDGANMRIYLDGIEVGSTPKTGSLSTNSSVDPWIGGNPPTDTRHPWAGAIDEVRIWNVARTQAQLQANSDNELTGNETGLQAYYQFNEGTGQTIIDQTGNNNTVLGSTSGTDTNDPTFANDPTFTNGCPEDYAFGSNGGLSTTIVNGNVVYETNGELESTQTIGPGSNVDYNAGTSISLLPSFEVLTGSQLHAYIEGCSVVVPPMDCYDPWADNGTNLANRVRRLMESPYRTGFGANTTGGTSNLVVVTNPAATGPGSFADVIDNAQAGDYIIFDPAHTVYMNECLAGQGCSVPGSVTIDGSQPTGQYVTLRRQSSTYHTSLTFMEGNNIVTNLKIDHDTKGSAVSFSHGENYWLDAVRIIAKQDDALSVGSAISDQENSGDNVTISRYRILDDSGKGLIMNTGGMSCQNDPNIPGTDIALNQRRAHVTIIDCDLAAGTRNIFNKGGFADIIGSYIHGRVEQNDCLHGGQTIIRCSYVDARTVRYIAIRAHDGPYEVGGNAANASFCPDDSEVFLHNNIYRQPDDEEEDDDDGFDDESTNPRINVSGSFIKTIEGGHMTDGITNWNNPATGRPVFNRPYEADILPFCISPTASSNAGPAFVLGEICTP